MAELEWNGDDLLKNLSIEVNEGVRKGLETLRGSTYDLSRVDTSRTRDSYYHTQEESGLVFTGEIGSPDMNAIYEEFGTGEYAENKDGRKGGWVYPKDGQFYFTYGKTPNKPMRRAYSKEEANVIQMLEDAISKGLDEK